MVKRLTKNIAAFALCAAVIGCSQEMAFDQLSPGDELIVLTRNSPTTYFFDGDEATGFEYELVKQYAETRGLSLRVKVAFTLEELIGMLSNGEGHIAAAGLTLTPERDSQFLATDSYLVQQPLVIYKSGMSRPRMLENLQNKDIVALAGSSHVELLKEMKRQLPELRWREIRAADTLELMQQVTEEKAELAIIDSVEFRIQQRLFPRLVAALELNGEDGIAWYLPDKPGARTLLEDVNKFLTQSTENGALEALKERHFGSVEFASRISSFTFQRKVRSELPQWQALIEEVASEYQLDWRLLAAVSYQESHWDPKAKSPTGVRGMMMITQNTAKDLGVKNRLDARESLRGGARFLKNLMRRLPIDIDEPHRTWMALAAYNIGMGHLEDARVLAERAGLDPHRWQDVREQLPKLQNPDIYPTTRYGFARGKEALTYVANIRHYYNTLQLRSMPDNKMQPPLRADDLLTFDTTDLLPLGL